MRFKLSLTPSLIYLLIGIIVLSSCKKNLEDEMANTENKSIESFLNKNKWTFSTPENGIYHVVRVPAYSYQVSKGDTVEFWYKGYTLDGKVFDTNVESVAIEANLDITIRSFDPLKVIAGKSNLIDGLDNGLLLLKDGEYATILFPSTLGFSNNAIGSVKQWSPLAFDIQVIRLNGPGIEMEKSFIDGLNLDDVDFTLDSSGLYYKYLILGLDSIPSINDTIYGHYRGTLNDGTIIEDRGSDNQPIILSTSTMPEGVKLGFMLTRGGGTTNLVLPSYLGFGNKKYGNIPPYQTLFYQIRLDSIK